MGRLYLGTCADGVERSEKKGSSLYVAKAINTNIDNFSATIYLASVDGTEVFAPSQFVSQLKFK